MTKEQKLAKLENAIQAVEQGVYSYACIAIEDICGKAMFRYFESLFCPKWALDGRVWTFSDTGPEVEEPDSASIDEARLLAMCLFYEIVKEGG